MTWNPTPIEDGDLADADSVNDQLDGASTSINDLTDVSLRRGAFNHFHATNLYPSGTPITISGDDGQMVYTFGTFGVSVDYASWGASGGTETAASYTGDRAIVGHPDAAAAGTPYTGPMAKLTMPGFGFKLGMAQGERVAGIELRSNVQIRKMVLGTAATGDLEAMVCLQFQIDGAGSWHTIRRTESFVSFSDHVLDDTSATELLDIDVPIACFMDGADITAAGGSIAVDRVTGFRMMTSIVNPSGAACALHIHRWRLSALPLHAKLES